MNLLLNGETRDLAVRTIAELLKQLETPAQGVAVAVNGRVVRRAEHAGHELQPGDEVEIIRAVQGG